MMAKKELIVLMTVQTDRLSTADNKPPTLLSMSLQVRIQLVLPTVYYNLVSLIYFCSFRFLTD